MKWITKLVDKITTVFLIGVVGLLGYVNWGIYTNNISVKFLSQTTRTLWIVFGVGVVMFGVFVLFKERKRGVEDKKRITT